MNLRRRSPTWLGILTVAILGFSSGGARAGWLPETRLTAAQDASYLSDNNGHCLVTDPDGDVHLVWFDCREGEAEVYYKRFDGTDWGHEQPLTSSDYSSEYPSLAADSVGNLHLVWSRYTGSDGRIYYRHFDGASWGPVEAISDPAIGSDKPAIAADCMDRVHVVWREYRAGSWGIYYRVFDGAVWSDIERIDEAPSYPGYASIAVNDSNRVHVAWADYRDGNWEVYYKLYDGTSWGPDERLTVDSSISQWPTMMIDTFGAVHVFWEDNREGDFGIYHKVNDGGGWSADECVVESLTNARRPSVAAADSGRILLVWYRDEGSDPETYCKEFDGITWSEETRLSVGAGASLNPAVAVDGDGCPHVVWHDERDGNFEIYWRHDRDLARPDLVSVEPDSGVAYHDVHVTDLAGTGFFYGIEVWMQKAGEPDIEASNIVIESPVKISCDFSLDDADPGYWDVVIRNIDGQSDTLQSSFNVLPLPRPEILSIAPDSEFAYQYVQDINLAGTGFFQGAEVCLQKSGHGTIIATDVVVESPNLITCDLALAAEGFWDMVVQNVDGKCDTLESGFYVIPLPKPEIVSVTPAIEYAYESVHVSDLAGNGFFPGAEVHLQRSGEADIAALGLVVESFTRITCDFGLAGADSGYWDVVIESPDGKGDTLLAGFEVLPALWSEDVRLTNTGGASRTTLRNGRCVAVDSLGNAHVVWYDNTPGNDEVYYRRQDGTSWDPAERLTVAAGDSRYPAVAVDSNGNAHVVWSDLRDGNWQIYYKFFEMASGWSPDLRLTDGSTDFRHPSIAIGPGDEIYVVYERMVAAPKVYLTWYDGAAWQPEVLVSDAPFGHEKPAVAADGADQVHVVWFYDYLSSDHIYYRKFDGTAWRAIVDLRFASGAAGPSIAADGSNNVHVAWYEYGTPAGAALSHEVYYRKFNGAEWEPAQLISDGPGDAQHASVAADDDGNVYLVWAEMIDSNREIHYAKSDGSRWGLAIRLTDAPDDSDRPSLAVGPDGKAHLVWSDLRDGNYEIYYKQRDAGSLAGIQAGGPEPPAAGLLSIAPNPSHSVTQIGFHLSARANANVAIYDITGRLVFKIALGDLAPGTHHVNWNLTDQSGHPVAPGVYLVRFRAGAQTKSAKIVHMN